MVLSPVYCTDEKTTSSGSERRIALGALHIHQGTIASVGCIAMRDRGPSSARRVLYNRLWTIRNESGAR